uniref:Transferrin-like domain-containing protein n=1 Tax=Pectinophora gossypiella TaxID=13191 RepID=A0A1E1WT36_PECGO
MALRNIAVLFLTVGLVAGQTYRVCIPTTDRTLCNSLDRDGSQATCEPVESRIDCALRLARGSADIGVFTEEETLVLGQQQPNNNRVIATIRDVSRTEPYAFEAVAIVSNSHSGGLEGLRGGSYCHPGLDQSDQRWSPRVLRTLEQAVARTNRCTDPPPGRTSEELEVDQLSQFFSAACRPGPWSVNATVDANLKQQFPSLCSLCGPTNASCAAYTLDMGVSVAGASNTNRHIQALECMRTNGNGSFAYVAWQHAQEFFTARNPDIATAYAVLCPDGSTQTLTSEVISNRTAPCAFVRQPWSTIVASTATAAEVQQNLRAWWPNGANPSDNSWQATLFNGIVGGASARVFFEDSLPSPANYTSPIRTIPAIDATATCLPARRWCTISTLEQTKCSWVRASAYSLGLEPPISCQQRPNILECLNDIREDRADFVTSKSNYGYLARQHYQLSPVKLVQNSRSSSSAFSRVAAFVKESSAQNNVTRFENLRGTKACFPEYGGIAYVAFVRTAQERGIISPSECDYARAVGEFFDGACAPGALDAAHALSQSSFNATTLCTACRPTVTIVGNYSDFTCTWDYSSNLYYGNNGTLSCLADPTTSVAFLQVQNIQAHLNQLGLDGSQFRALCRNNTLAATTGVNVDNNCLLAYVVDAEVVTRRNDPLTNALAILLENLDLYFGYIAESGAQLINLEIFSPFDGVSDLLFKDTAIGLTEPSATSSNEPARNYMELFQHLESCTGAAAPGIATKNFYSIFTIVLMSLFTRFVVY